MDNEMANIIPTRALFVCNIFAEVLWEYKFCVITSKMSPRVRNLVEGETICLRSSADIFDAEVLCKEKTEIENERITFVVVKILRRHLIGEVDALS